MWQRHNTTRLDSIEIPVKLRNKGTMTLNVFPVALQASQNRLDKVSVEIVYKPETSESGPLFLGYRNDVGMGNTVKMEATAYGTWKASREMFSNESSELSLHRVDPSTLNSKPDFNGLDHFQTQIPLIDNRIVSENFVNPKLLEEGKTGSLQRRIYKKDGSLSQPLDEQQPLHLHEGEELIHIYLPNAYEKGVENHHEYPLIVMLDGDMHVGTDAYDNNLHTPVILDNLIAERKMEPSVVVFTAPTPPTIINTPNRIEYTPRLREYGCNPETAANLSKLPSALKSAGLSVSDHGAGIVGASMGGLQAIYTAKMYPNIFNKVIAQSPSLWWEPPVKLEGSKHDVQYDIANTWRKDPKEKFNIDFNHLSEDKKAEMSEIAYKGFIHEMFTTGVDRITEKSVPPGNIEIILQVGRNETGVINPKVGKEPLTQATKTLAKDFNLPLKILDGPHSPHIWASGLCEALPQAYPRIEMTRSFRL